MLSNKRDSPAMEVVSLQSNGTNQSTVTWLSARGAAIIIISVTGENESK